MSTLGLTTLTLPIYLPGVSLVLIIVSTHYTSICARCESYASMWISLDTGSCWQRVVLTILYMESAYQVPLRISWQVLVGLKGDHRVLDDRFAFGICQ